MLPVLILALLWIGSLVTEFTGKPICRKVFTCLLFPLGFVILACLRIAVYSLRFFEEFKMSGPMDSMQFGDDGLVFTRSLIWIVGLAAASFFTAVITMLCRGDRPRTKN